MKTQCKDCQANTISKALITILQNSLFLILNPCYLTLDFKRENQRHLIMDTPFGRDLKNHERSPKRYNDPETDFISLAKLYKNATKSNSLITHKFDND